MGRGAGVFAAEKIARRFGFLGRILTRSGMAPHFILVKLKNSTDVR